MRLFLLVVTIAISLSYYQQQTQGITVNKDNLNSLYESGGLVRE